MKDAIYKYLIVISAVSMLCSGMWMIFRNSDHPNLLPGILLAFSVLVFFIIFNMASRGKIKYIQYWSNRAQDIADRYHGKLNLIERVLDKGSYSVDFNYKGHKFEYRDILMISRPPSSVEVAEQFILEFVTPAASDFALDMSTKIGESVIGKTFDKCFSKEPGLKDISKNSSLSVYYNGVNIYSDKEEMAVRFLLDNDVKEIYSRYIQANAGAGLSLPLQVRRGCVCFMFLGRMGRAIYDFKKENNFDPYLNDLILLSNKLI